MNNLVKHYEGMELQSIEDKGIRKFVKLEREKEELKKSIKITSYEELQELINKFRGSLIYRKVGCSFYIPTPNYYGEKIIGKLVQGSSMLGASINYHLESGKPFGNLSRESNTEMFPLVIKDGQNNTKDRNDWMIKDNLSPQLFGNSVGHKTINIKSVLSEMVANIEYDMRIPLPKEMTEEEEQEYINSFLQTKEIKELIYGSIKNIKSFKFNKINEQWSEVL
jgi:hypothetical protein